MQTEPMIGTIVAVLATATIIKADGQEFYGHFSAFIVDSEKEIQKGLPVTFRATGSANKRPQARYIKLLTK